MPCFEMALTGLAEDIVNRILKIAGGVFLGILAAFAVYKVVEIWQSQAAEKRVEEDLRLAAKAERLRLTKAAENLPILQPDKLEALCGVSLRVRRDAKGGHVELNISHMGADGHVVEMNFHCLPAGCNFQGMHQADATPEDWGHPKKL